MNVHWEVRSHPSELMKEKGFGGTATSTAPVSCVTFYIERLRDGSS